MCWKSARRTEAQQTVVKTRSLVSYLLDSSWCILRKLSRNLEMFHLQRGNRVFVSSNICYAAKLTLLVFPLISPSFPLFFSWPCSTICDISRAIRVRGYERAKCGWVCARRRLIKRIIRERLKVRMFADNSTKLYTIIRDIPTHVIFYCYIYRYAACRERWYRLPELLYSKHARIQSRRHVFKFISNIMDKHEWPRLHNVETSQSLRIRFITTFTR